MASRNSSHTRIILAIVKKDIAQAIKDRMILGVIIGVFLLILPSQLLPIILENENTLTAVIVGIEPTALANALSKLPDTTAYSVKSLSDLKDEIVSGRGSIIGLSLPDDYSSKITTKERIDIDGYLAHWIEPESARTLEKHFENEIRLLTNSPVEITIVNDQVYPDEDTRGLHVMFILQMINAIMTITLILVPQLFITEKETHTLDAMLISPASLTDLIIGKGLVGVFYAAIAVSIVVLMNIRIIAHWPLLIVSIISGIFIAVFTGLLIGLAFDNYQQSTFAIWIVGIFAIAPSFIKLILTAELPKIIDVIVNWSPSGQLTNLLLMSLMKTVDNQSALLGLGSIWLFNVALLYLTLWRVNQQTK